MIRTTAFLATLLLLVSPIKATENIVNWGLSTGSEPRSLCVYDTSHNCVAIGTLNSTTHLLLPTNWINRTINFAGGTGSTPDTSWIYGKNQKAQGTCTNSISCDLNIVTADVEVDGTAAANQTRANFWLYTSGASSKGGLTGLWVKTGPAATPQSNTDRNYYVAGTFDSEGNFTAGSGGALSSVWSLGNYAEVTAAGWNSIAGIEQDLACASSCNVNYVAGVGVVLLPGNTTAAVNENVAYNATVSSPGTATFDTVYSIGGYQGWLPVASTGGIMKCRPHASAGACRDPSSNSTITYGIDLSDLTFSSSAFKSTGFLVDGSGNITGHAYTVGATAGVSCSGSPTASFASINGIVTHC